MRKMSKKGNVNEMNDDDDEEEEKNFSRRDKLFMLINLCICVVLL